MPINLINHRVVLVKPMIYCDGLEGIAAGELGVVRFDDGTADEVVVEFQHEVPKGGFMCDKSIQAWVHRSFIQTVNQ